MSIIVENNIFHLTNGGVSYIIGILNDRLEHIYWGPAIKENDVSYITEKSHVIWSNDIDIETLEMPFYGTGDYRIPMLELQFDDGSRIIDLKCEAYEVFKGKKPLDGLPATFESDIYGVESLHLLFHDELKKIHLLMKYSIFENGAITRSVELFNKSSNIVKINKIHSASIDFLTCDFEVITLQGAWARERHICRQPVQKGLFQISSNRGHSSHTSNPFMALVSPSTTEMTGDVYGMNLIYSGNFQAQIEVSPFEVTRFQMGLSDFDFSWQLQPGCSFVTPEVVLVYSSSGLNGMSQIYHGLYKSNLCRSDYKNKNRPILINNWEATYFDFDEKKLLSIAEAGKSIGLEMFVLDDGWFGSRNDDRSSLGDWTVNINKLPNGLEDLAIKVNDIGLTFGLWIEPEMISPDSDLFRLHPEWCLHVPNRRKTETRHQLVLDLSRQEVCDYIIDTVSKVLESANIEYVKWDMNRSMTEIGSSSLNHLHQMEIGHRYILGLYNILETITSRFPNILFEGCSGGGGRFDGGMMYYMPQHWVSDNTDAYERLMIQYGTSLVYPVSAMGCHISDVPNHQTHRVIALESRAHIAMSGVFGFELDLSKVSDEEKDMMKKFVRFYKENRELYLYGDFYRLSSPFINNYGIWQHVSKDKTESIVCVFKKMHVPNMREKKFRLTGLDKDKLYCSEDDAIKMSGNTLMNVGLVIPKGKSDFESFIIKFVEAT